MMCTYPSAPQAGVVARPGPYPWQECFERGFAKDLHLGRHGEFSLAVVDYHSLILLLLTLLNYW